MRTDPKLISLCLLAILAFSATYVVFSDDSSADSVEQDYTRYYYDQLDSDLAKYLYDQFRQLPAENNGRDGIHADGDPAIVFERDYDLNAFASNPTTNINDIEDEFGEAANAAFYAFQHECYDIYWIKHVRSPTVFRWYDSYSWDGEGVITSFHVRFCLYLEDSYPAQESARNQVWEAMNSIPLDMTNRYTAVRSAHDAAVKILGYSAHLRDHDDNGYNCDIRSVYEAFVGDHAVVCEAYSKVFKALCDMHGIPCILVDGDAGNSREAHMWNYVQMEDGKWYAVDCTWDDQSLITYDYLLAGTNTPVFNGATFGQDHFPALSTDSGDFRIPPLADERYNAYHTVSYVTTYGSTVTIDVEHGGTIIPAAVDVDPLEGLISSFTHWNTEMNGSGTDYEANIPAVVNSNLTLYAIWGGAQSGTGTISWDIVDGVLTISGTGAMPDYTFEDNRPPWFPYRNTIWKAVVEDGITYVGNFAFHSCTRF